jgi:hypothetical protein
LQLKIVEIDVSTIRLENACGHPAPAQCGLKDDRIFWLNLKSSEPALADHNPVKVAERRKGNFGGSARLAQ